MSAVFSLIMVIGLVLVAYGGAKANLHFALGAIIPMVAIAIFILGFIYRIIRWARSPVPFRIPTTCGQQKTLPWIKSNKLESPSTTTGVLGRMFLEIFFFRSLFRNTRSSLKGGPKLVFGPTKWLWAAGLAFHYSFLIIFLRHFRFFAEPIPAWVVMLQDLDGFFQIGLPILYMTDVIILAAVSFLFIRRVFIPQLRYISLASDYFPLFLILGIAISGVYMRYFTKVDIVGVKELATGLMSFHPTVPAGITTPFLVHFFLVCVLMAYFPFSKLMHLGGVFLSPTRNLANNNRMVRHVNPWNYPVKVHTYEEYEDEFRDLMKEAGLPLEKDVPSDSGQARAASGNKAD